MFLGNPILHVSRKLPWLFWTPDFSAFESNISSIVSQNCFKKAFVSYFSFFSRKMSRKIFIGNLPDRADGRDVEDFFRGCGRIVEISLKDGYGNLQNVKPFVNLDF